MTTPDTRIAELVRRTLSRHWIDLTQIRYSCTTGTVRFNGTMQRRGGGAPPLRIPLLELIGNEIKSIPGVKKVYFTGVEIKDGFVGA